MKALTQIILESLNGCGVISTNDQIININ